METMASLVIVLVLCFIGLAAAAEYNITRFGMPTRSFDCPLPPNCPWYLETYLTNYGYLNPRPNKPCTVKDIEVALRRFQGYNLGTYIGNVTGECDADTLILLRKPRCGCEDIVKEDPKKKMMMRNNLLAPQEFQVGSKWSKKHLTWKVVTYPVKNNHLKPAAVDDAMRRGLDIWAQQTPLTFQQVTGSTNADINIRFVTRRHQTQGPFYDFDGPSPQGPVLAHAFFPESGEVHFDDDESFVLNNDQGTELYIVAAHEFGHTLGISHSNVNDALMAPYYRYSANLKLHPDDIQAVQYQYGVGTGNKVSTRPTTRRPAPTTEKPNMPDYCNMRIQAAFKLNYYTYVFTADPSDGYRTYVYTVTSNGILANSRKPLSALFKKQSTNRWPRAHPYRVDSAAYIPSTRSIFLMSGTRVYRYSVTRTSGPFILDEAQKFPKWMDVSEFPERPRAAVPMPLPNNRYYMLVFGSSMVWDWDFESQRVGAWAYPISSFGRNMPTNVHTAFLEDSDYVAFIKGDQYIRFNLRYRRVIDDGNSVKSVKRDFFKAQCA